MNVSRHLREGERGSVLMETVLSLPIYMVLIGGTLWLGDLNLSRQTLLAADRYAAWNEGNRLGGAGTGESVVWRRFFERNPDQTVQKVDTQTKDSDWYCEVTGEVTADIRMPQWTVGMLYAGVPTWEAQQLQRNQRLTGRDSPHLVVMRGGDRSEKKDEVNWVSVRRDSWYPGTGGGGGGGGSFGSATPEYRRFGRFIMWSD